MTHGNTGRCHRHSAMQDYRRYLQNITTIQTEIVRRLTETNGLPPLEIAAALEDVANQYLNLSDEIRGYALSHRETG